MKAKRRTDILTDTLDTLDVFSKWFLSVAVIVWWAGLSSVKTIEILGIKIERSKSFAIMGLFFVIMNAVFYQYFRRISLVLQTASEEDNNQEVLSVLFFHPWILNPFGIYSRNEGVLSGFHISFLVIIWWLCNLSLYALYSFYSIKGGRFFEYGIYLIVMFLFALFGLLTMSQILSIYRNLRVTIGKADQKMQQLFSAQFRAFQVMLTIGVLIGFFITVIIMLCL